MKKQLADTDTAIFIITFHFFYSIIPKLNLILKKKKKKKKLKLQINFKSISKFIFIILLKRKKLHKSRLF